jgi:hypothetical protein
MHQALSTVLRPSACTRGGRRAPACAPWPPLMPTSVCCAGRAGVSPCIEADQAHERTWCRACSRAGRTRGPWSRTCRCTRYSPSSPSRASGPAAAAGARGRQRARTGHAGSGAHALAKEEARRLVEVRAVRRVAGRCAARQNGAGTDGAQRAGRRGREHGGSKGVVGNRRATPLCSGRRARR